MKVKPTATAMPTECRAIKVGKPSIDVNTHSEKAEASRKAKKLNQFPDRIDEGLLPTGCADHATEAGDLDDRLPPDGLPSVKWASHS